MNNFPAIICGQHTNYFCLRPEYLHAKLQLLSAEQRKIARKCSQLFFNTSSTIILINIYQDLGITTLEFKDSQTQCFYKKAREELSDLTSEANSADTMTESFESRKGVNYLYVIYHPNEGLLMITQQD